MFGPRLVPFVCLALVAAALALHWPGGAELKSDDYVAIRYASDLTNCLADFAGPQYDLTFFSFYRPFITLSFGLDNLLFGADPFGFLLMNALAVGVAAVLLFTLLRELVGGATGLALAAAVALLWIAHPIVVPSAAWGAGRVDTHVAPPLLLALWFHLRLRRGGKRWPVWAAVLVALATKESAIGFPLLALGIDLLDPHPSYRPAPALFGRALPALPYLLLIPAFLLLRLVVLGHIVGGYRFQALAGFDLAGMTGGLLNTIGGALNPGLPDQGRKLVAVAVLALLGVLMVRSAWKRQLAGVLLLAGGLFGPLAQVLPAMRSGDQRFAYLACAGVLAVWAVAAARFTRGRPLPTLVLAMLPIIFLWPAHRDRRAEFRVHDGFVRAVLDSAATCAEQLEPGDPVVLADAGRDPYRFLWGLGSCAKPPFAERARELVTLTPLHPRFPPATRALVCGGLKAWIRAGRTDVEPVLAPDSTREVAVPVGFDGTLDEPAVHALAKKTIGYRVGPDFAGQVAIASSIGAAQVEVQAKDGLLPLNRVLVPSKDAFILQVLWNHFDLAKGSPVFLFWKEGDRYVRASFSVTPAFADAIKKFLGG
ncbi:MAG: hypothetical protein CMJ85_01175 [Planctomycetes bacterium]|nr:hypothetical protein [Planctomycetota bacterium]